MGEHGSPRTAHKGAARKFAAKDSCQVVHQLVHEHVPGTVHGSAAGDTVQRSHLRVGLLKVNDKLVAARTKELKQIETLLKSQEN